MDIMIDCPAESSLTAIQINSYIFTTRLIGTHTHLLWSSIRVKTVKSKSTFRFENISSVAREKGRIRFGIFEELIQ